MILHRFGVPVSGTTVVDISKNEYIYIYIYM